MKFNKRKILFFFIGFLCFTFLMQGIGIAQDKEIVSEIQKVKETLYTTYVENLNGNTKQKKKSLKAGREYVERFKDSEQDKQIIKYLEYALPRLEIWIKTGERPPHPPRTPKPLYRNFDLAYKAKEWNELFEVGEKILRDEPELLDVILVLASVGFNKMIKEKPDEKFVPVTITYAEKAIKLLESGKISKNFGAYDIQYKTKEYPDGKSNALGWMNYIIGYLKYHHLDQKQEAIPYFCKALEYKSEVKNFPEIQKIIDKFDINKMK